ncbi:hypothetical protein [Corynebacterium vitaeruminis]|uniref:Uncharacterized protein n=1 Tax=Corynebacterium vitaeruminis DSM 20294 TaxID=1224164 RepID=W5XZD7_9CORY|nr:hypothetical protein [Corynebacterium vitaeruminis]AHI22059.1 hypothetical protein B843_03340 [Corynebacterium vitaeruminis DSM 20294]
MVKRLKVKSTSGRDVIVYPLVRKMTLETVRDLRGFPVGVLISPTHNEASVALRVDNPAAATVGAWRQWEHDVAEDETVIATCLSVSASEVLLWVTFESTGKTERKDSGEFLTRIARALPAAYDAADTLALAATPLDADQLTKMIALAVGSGDDDVFPPLIRQLSEHAGAVATDMQFTASFEIGEIAAEPDFFTTVIDTGLGLADAAQDLATVRVGLWSRTAANEADSPRVVGVVSISALDGPTVDDLSEAMISQFSPKQRLRVRRLWGRQAIAALASLGCGVLAWQHLEVAA